MPTNLAGGLKADLASEVYSVRTHGGWIYFRRTRPRCGGITDLEYQLYLRRFIYRTCWLTQFNIQCLWYEDGRVVKSSRGSPVAIRPLDSQLLASKCRCTGFSAPPRFPEGRSEGFTILEEARTITFCRLRKYHRTVRRWSSTSSLAIRAHKRFYSTVRHGLN